MKKSNKIWLWSGAALVVLGLAAGGIALQSARGKTGDKAAAEKKSPPQPTPEFVAGEIGRAQLRELAQLVEASGTLAAERSATVRAKVGAEVREVLAREGDSVVAGQVLVRLDDADLRQRVVAAEGALASAEARAANARRSRDMQKALLDQQYISPNAFDTADAAFRAADGEVAAARAQVNIARQALSDAVVRAPLAGTVAKRHVQPGEKVGFDAPLLQVVDLGSLELQAWVPPQLGGELRVGQPVEVRVEGLDQPVRGQVGRVLPAVDASTRQVGVIVRLANEGARLKVGMNATARVRLAAREALTVPLAALVNVNGEYHAWQIVDGDKVSRKRLEIGQRNDADGLVEVKAGVESGARVLLGRYETLKEGQAVKLVAERGSTQAAAAGASAASLAAR